METEAVIILSGSIIAATAILFAVVWLTRHFRKPGDWMK